MSIVWVTSAGPSHRANKLGVIRWMGTSIVRVDLPQMKSDGQEGGKLPGSLSTRRSRGSRGRRTGRARVGKTRSLARAAARELAKRTGPGNKGTSASRLAKARVKRAKWIESRFTFIGDWLKDEIRQGKWSDLVDGTLRDIVETLYRVPRYEKVRKLFFLRIKQLSDNFHRKRVPCGPFGGHRPDTWGWFRRFWEIKYGTWEDVSWLGEAGNSPVGPMGLLRDGFHTYPEQVLNPVTERDQSRDSRPKKKGLTPREMVQLHRSNARRGRGETRPSSRALPALRGKEWEDERKRLDAIRRG